MGAVLIRSAFSANIKERRDCSTALFDERGRMIAQAEHIPVHLGALPDAIAAVRAHDPAPEDVFILNDPYAGGTHLPDITLVSRTAVGFAATRAHHADVGAAEPGDLRAQLAANRLASRRLEELCARRGRELVVVAMDELHDYAERRVRAAIAALPDGRFDASDVLEAEEGDLEVRAAVTIDGDELEIDFAGTAPQHEGNLNCPLAVTRSASYFVIRCLTDPD